MAKTPKIIHYCWFGNMPIPEDEKEYIEGWKKIFPEYVIKKWNEDNFDVQQCEFSSQAYQKEKYAFVSDYARAKILYEYGGIYLDTDVEIVGKFPEIQGIGYVGFERRKFLGTAVIACEPKNEIIRQMVEFYENHSFIGKDGNMDIVANVSLLTDIMLKKDLKLGGEEQDCGGFHIYPREVFYPKKLSEEEFRITTETIAIHHCKNSWMSLKEKKRGQNKFWIEIVRPVLQKMKMIFKKILGEEKTRMLEIKIRNILK